MDKQTHAEAVKQFTTESTGVELPTHPTPFTVNDVRFLAKMCFSEIIEILQSEYSKEESYLIAKQLIDEDQREKNVFIGSEVNKVEPELNPVEKMAMVADGVVDTWYYGLNALAKHGINAEPIFRKVQEANMAKKNPVTNTFEKRADGKIIKPLNWKEPDIIAEIENQIKNGAWN